MEITAHEISKYQNANIIVTITKFPDNKKKPAKNIRELLRNARRPNDILLEGHRKVAGVKGLSLPSVGTSFSVRLSQETIGRLKSCWEYVVVQKTKDYFIFLKDTQTSISREGYVNRRSFFDARFDASFNGVKDIIESIGIIKWVEQEDNFQVDNNATDNEHGFEKPIKIQPLRSMNLLLVAVPETKISLFEGALRKANLEFQSLSPVPLRLSLSPMVRRFSHSVEQNAVKPAKTSELAAPKKIEPNPISVCVGILDTGIDPTEANFHDEGGDFAEFDRSGGYALVTARETDTHERHGTEVAKIIAHTSPSAKLVIALATPHRTATIHQIISAMNWLIYVKNVDVVNMSFVAVDENRLAVYKQTFRKAIGGIIRDPKFRNDFWIVAATGNNGPGRVGCPAAFRGFVSVGATNPQDVFWESSGHGYVDQEEDKGFHPEFIILGSRLGISNTSGHVDLATSFAAPRITGIIANFISRGLEVSDALVASSRLVKIGKGDYLGTTKHIKLVNLK